jgi:TonB-linked SusC/RagA family outer membrane protein
MRKIFGLILCMSIISLHALAQNLTVTGKVTDATGKAISGATVAVKGGSNGVKTDENGFYNLSLPKGKSTLVFSYIGYELIEKAVSTSSVQNVTLKIANNDLSEVVVTGYASQRKSQFTGAATVLSAAKVVENTPVGSFDQALQGRAPGLLVNSSSGQPGSSASLTIRGVQSISGATAQPLYILDGVPLPAQDMQSLNPNDFESITVLKDAGAAALYGARGGLGVIVITSKKGKAGATNFTFRSQLGVTQAPNTTNYDLMTTSEILQYEEKLGLQGAATNTPGWNYSKKNPSYASQTPATQARYDFLRDSISKIDNNWSNILFRQGISQTHELNLSGGMDKTRFFASIGVFDQKGTDLNSRLRRYTSRFNLDHNVGNLSIQFNTSLGYSITNLSEGEWYGNSTRNAFQMAWRAKPYESIYKPDGTLNFGTSSSIALKQVANLLEGTQNSLWDDYQYKLRSGLTIAYKIIPELTLKNTVGIDAALDRWQRSIRPASFVGSLQIAQNGTNSEAFETNSNIINTTSTVFNKIYGRSDIEVGAYFEVVRGYQKGLGFQLWNLDPRLYGTGQGTGTLPVAAGATTYPQNASSAKSGYGIRSYFATARYSFDNKYTLTGNIRRDGTSRILNENNKQITTYSFGATWNAIKENFFSKINAISDLRVRASYGEVPNIGSINTGSYGVTGGLVGVTNYLGPQIPSYGTTTGFAGSTITGQVPTTPGNPNLKIETIKKLNVGADIAFLKNRLRLTADVYSNRTVDLFVSQPLGATTGFGGTTLPINAGVMTNKGVELSLNIDIVKNKEFDFTLGFNHAINKNNIEDLGLVNEYVTGTSIIRKGIPFGSAYAYKYLGAEPANGLPKYETLDGKITNDIAKAGQFATFGSYLPKHVGGFTADFRFKQITLSTLFSYQFDVTRYNNIENWITRGTAGYHGAVNASRRLLTEQWEKPGDVKYYQAAIYDRGFTGSDVQDAKFLRFRTLNIAYQVPQVLIGKHKLIKSATFYIQGQNLWIWSPWKGQDPEDSNNISLNEFPNPRMIVGGININF